MAARTYSRTGAIFGSPVPRWLFMMSAQTQLRSQEKLRQLGEELSLWSQFAAP